jgi:hypothetical protein
MSYVMAVHKIWYKWLLATSSLTPYRCVVWPGLQVIHSIPSRRSFKDHHLNSKFRITRLSKKIGTKMVAYEHFTRDVAGTSTGRAVMVTSIRMIVYEWILGLFWNDRDSSQSRVEWPCLECYGYFLHDFLPCCTFRFVSGARYGTKSDGTFSVWLWAKPRKNR